MKVWMFTLLTLSVIALALTGCGQQSGEQGITEENLGGEELNQPLERVQALGTQLDRKPANTQTATFALG